MTLRALAQALVVTSLLGLTAAARADEPATAPPPATTSSSLQPAMERYFSGELSEGYIFFSLGSVALAAGGTLIAQDRPFPVGMGVPLLAVGVIELVAGLWLIGQTEARVARLGADIAASPTRFRERELARLRGVNLSFRVLKIVEGGLLAVGTVGALGGAFAHEEWIIGAGIGLALQSLAMLILDTTAERRAHRYVDRLTAVQITPTPRGPGLTVGVLHRF